MKTKIYILSDENGRVRYLGKTYRTLCHRLHNHIYTARHGGKFHVHNWIRLMLRHGQFPKIVLVGEVDGNGNKEEVAWIKYFKDEGFDLTNSTSGGDGGDMWREFKDAQRKQAKDKKHPPYKVIDLSADKIFNRAIEYDDAVNYENQAVSSYRTARLYFDEI